MPGTKPHSSSSEHLAIPAPIHRFFAKFPLYTYPEHTVAKKSSPHPCLWIVPPTPDIVLPSTNLLSADVECLKWQAYLALRGVKDLHVRWDIAPEAAVNGRLPSLLTPDGRVLEARVIPGWVDETLHPEAPLEGFVSEAAQEESRAWVSLLEGVVHTALILSNSEGWNLSSYLPKLSGETGSALSLHIAPPPAPLSGIFTIIPPFGERVSYESIREQYHEAISALSLRLDKDEWFLGSHGPTALDALAFAYLYLLLSGPEGVRLEVNKRENLVHWERRVRIIVQSSFTPANS